MSSLRALVQAPGKLLIVGEYAVLDGAPAVVAAIDRGVRCHVYDGDSIETPGDDRFVRAALQGAPRRRYVFSDWNPVDLPEKPGFGGSAAATVAAVVASGRPALDAIAIHQAVQGSGSGVDVFASAHGGVRRFPDGVELPCPPLVAVWSGQSARTGPRVERYLAWAGRQAFVAEMSAIVESFVDTPIEAVRAAYALLRGMAAAADIAYDLPVFGHIAALATGCGGAAKPSGAGGGDVAVALLPDSEAMAAFVARCDATGLRTIPVGIAPAAMVLPIAARPD